MKPWYTSRTVYGLVGAGLASFLMLIGADEATASQTAEAILSHAIPLIGLISSVYGYFGRKKATEPLRGPLQ